MNLREKVALALINSDREMAGLQPVKGRDVIPNSDGYLHNADAAIRTVLEALREPTQGMLDASWKQTGESKEMRPRTHIHYARHWQAMLDQAIREHAMDELIAGDADLMDVRELGRTPPPEQPTLR